MHPVRAEILAATIAMLALTACQSRIEVPAGGPVADWLAYDRRRDECKALPGYGVSLILLTPRITGNSGTGTTRCACSS
jgi:hypothetical protein